jgi:hypothetical protein
MRLKKKTDYYYRFEVFFIYISFFLSFSGCSGSVGVGMMATRVFLFFHGDDDGASTDFWEENTRK